MKTLLLVLLGLILVLPVAVEQSQSSELSEEAKQERARLIEQCEDNRGVDCDSDASIEQERLKDRTRSEAEADGSRSIHQTAPRPTPHAN